MTQSKTQTTQLKQLKTAYDKLSPLQQSIVQVLSVTYEKVSRTSLIACLRKLNIRHPSGKHFVTQTLDAFMEKLRPVIVVQKMGTPTLQCHELFVEIATREAIQEQRFDDIALAVQEAIPFPHKCVNLLREIRISFYRQDIHLVRKQIKRYEPDSQGSHPYVKIYFSIFVQNLFFDFWSAKFILLWCKIDNDLFFGNAPNCI
ncbi:MAG: hypothetical protein VSS75_027815 [Candidatus Parabeggiatoa sp.]|nr:hypothetical protein [Candidatus Parabeggiatoa sp.]